MLRSVAAIQLRSQLLRWTCCWTFLLDTFVDALTACARQSNNPALTLTFRISQLFNSDFLAPG